MIVCFFGDSLTLGYGDETGLGWPGRIVNTLLGQGQDVTGYNLGIRANTTIKLLGRWQREAERRTLTGQELHLVFSFGVADVANNVLMDISLDNAETILAEARAAAPPLIVGPTPVADPEKTAGIKRLSDELDKVCMRHHIPFIPTIDVMQASPVYRQALTDFDNVHPTAAGYAALAEYLVEDSKVRKFFGME